MVQQPDQVAPVEQAPALKDSELPSSLSRSAKAEPASPARTGDTGRFLPLSEPELTPASVEAVEEPTTGNFEKAGAPAAEEFVAAPKQALQDFEAPPQPKLPPRCIAHAGTHLLAATAADVIEGWRAMRDRFGSTATNKVKARRAMIDWFESQRNICSGSVFWYGDFFVVRSCVVRADQPAEAAGAEGWFIAFDPNGSGYVDHPLFADMFEVTRGAAITVHELGSPAWLSEARRLHEARALGLEQARPFTPASIDSIGAHDFVRGEAR